MPQDDAQSARRDWMTVLATADSADLARLLTKLPAHTLLRAPEIGLVMVQGRTGATGAPFNLGEMTVTRASVQLETGEVGHAMIKGRNKDHALRAALADALLQGPQAEDLAHSLIAPLRALKAAARETRAAKAAATRVEFFTMVRGEDK